MRGHAIPAGQLGGTAPVPRPRKEGAPAACLRPSCHKKAAVGRPRAHDRRAPDSDHQKSESRCRLRRQTCAAKMAGTSAKAPLGNDQSRDPTGLIQAAPERHRPPSRRLRTACQATTRNKLLKRVHGAHLAAVLPTCSLAVGRCCISRASCLALASGILWGARALRCRQPRRRAKDGAGYMWDKGQRWRLQRGNQSVRPGI